MDENIYDNSEGSTPDERDSLEFNPQYWDYVIKKDELDYKEARAEKRAERIYDFICKHWIFLSIVIISVLLILALLIWSYQSQKKIPMAYDSIDLIGQKYEDVVLLLTEAGFTNIQAEPTNNLPFDQISKENTVCSIYLSGENFFFASTEHPYDTPITVKYHSLKTTSPPLSSKEAKGKNYEIVAKQFINEGFVNLKFNIEYDIITGWFTENGEIESVTINGDKKFSENDVYRIDAEIVITYHTYKSNKP